LDEVVGGRQGRACAAFCSKAKKRAQRIWPPKKHFLKLLGVNNLIEILSSTKPT